MPVDAGTIYSEIRVALDKLKGDLKSAEAAFDKFGKSNETQAKSTEARWKSAFKTLSIGAVLVTAAIGAAFKAAVSTFADFEQAIANVGSVAKATPDEFKRIEEAAISAGESTRFTARQAADALYYLASAGFNATKSIAALDGVLTLAGATGSDLAATSSAVAATISQYSLEAEQATDVANVFAAAITNSQATMEKMTTALTYVGPVASSMNKSLEETAGVLQILFNNGFAASQAGTALRSALSDLSNETSPAIAKLKALGITFAEVDPRTNSLADVFDVLSKNSRVGAEAMSIFGDRAGPAMIKLIQGGREEIEKYTAAVTGTNAAADAYAIQNDTLAGSIDFLKSAIESAQIKFVKEFEPILRSVIDALTGLVKWFGNLPGPIKIMITAAAGLAVAIIGVSSAVSLLSGAFTVFAGPIGIAAAALVGFVGLIAGLAAAVKDAETKNLRLARSIQAQGEATATQIERFEELNKKTSLNAEEKAELIELEGKLKTALGSTGLVLDEVTGKFGISTEAVRQYNLQIANNALAALNAQLVESVKLRRKVTAQLEIENTQRANEFGHAERLKQLKADEARIIAENNGLFIERQGLLEKISDLENPAEAARRKAEEDRKAALEKELADKAAILAANNKLYPELLNNLEAVNRAADAGAITEKNALEQKIKLRQEYLDFLQTEAVESGDLSAQNIANIQAEQAKIEAYQARIAALKEAEKADDEDIKLSKQELIEAQDDYNSKLEQLGKTQKELIEIQRAATLANLAATAAGVEGYDELIDKVNEYYDALANDEANQTFDANVQGLVQTSATFLTGLLGAVGDLYSALTERRLADLDRQLQAELEAAGLAEETKIESLERQLEEATAAGDTEAAQNLEQAIEKEQILKDYEKKKAQLQYKAALVQWRLNLLNAIAGGAMAILNGFSTQPFLPLGLLAGILATGLAAVQIVAVAKAKPQPPSFATGGIVIPSGGRGKTIEVAENNSPEMMLNAGTSGKPFMNEFADAIAARLSGAGNGGGFFNLYLSIDGRLLAESSATYYNNGVVRIKL